MPKFDLPTTDGRRLSSEEFAVDGRPVLLVLGEIELDGKVLVIKHIQFNYSGVQIPDDKREAAERALATHHRSCPVTRSIEASIEITTGWA
jgi:uncharacterized OsmC-like protein